MTNRFAAEVLEVLPVGDKAMNEAESALGGLSGDRFDEFVENAFGHDAEKFADLRVGDFIAGVSDSLLEEREAVAEAAFGGARKNSDCAWIDFEIFGFGDALDFAGNFLERERAKVEELRARFDRVDEIFRASGGEDEDDAFGRLFECLQKGVGCFVGELVSFIENHDFVAARRRRVANHFAELANLINAAIGGGVDFENVERSAGGNFAAGVARVVGLGGGAFHAVEGLREDSRRGGFAHAANAGKDVGVGDAIRFDGVRERLGDVLLADNLSECLRAIFSSDDFIAHRESVTRNL
jgi:hypothetical protein